MPSRLNRFQVGIVLTVSGLLLLFFTTGVIQAAHYVWPAVAVIVGLFALRRAFWGDGREVNVFVGTFLLLTGVFLLLRVAALPHATFIRVWPIFMSFGGLALLSYAFWKGREYRLIIGVPAAAIVMLSVIFLLFSLDVIKMSFSLFVLQWWPLMLIFWGGVTVWSYLERRRDDTVEEAIDELPEEEDL